MYYIFFLAEEEEEEEREASDVRGLLDGCELGAATERAVLVGRTDTKVTTGPAGKPGCSHSVQRAKTASF